MITADMWKMGVKISVELDEEKRDWIVDTADEDDDERNREEEKKIKRKRKEVGEKLSRKKFKKQMTITSFLVQPSNVENSLHSDPETPQAAKHRRGGLGEKKKPLNMIDFWRKIDFFKFIFWTPYWVEGGGRG